MSGSSNYEKFAGSEGLLNSADENKSLHDSALPSPVSAQAQRPKSKIPAAAIIPIWMCLSSSVILYNNHLYSTLDFQFPVFVVTWHLTFAVSTFISSLLFCLFIFAGYRYQSVTTDHTSLRRC
jgi:hypothetical protein